MRVSRQLLAEHRTEMLLQASRLFRANGITAVGVADVTRAAGLTHGAFYGHFPSKTALAAEACRESLARAATRWRGLIDTAPDDPLGTLIDQYLAPAHRDHPGGGCALAALGAETTRDPILAAGMTAGTEHLLAALEALLAHARPTLPAGDRAATALAVLAAMNGGLQLARALAAHPDRSDAALAAARASARAAACS